MNDATNAITCARALVFAAALTVCLAACGTSTSPSSPRTHKSSGKDAGALHDAGVSCIPSPKTHLEIINACTDAEVVDKQPELPLLLADGGLPPLP